MSADRRTLALTLTIAATFVFLYANLGWTIVTHYLLPLTLAEAAILSTQVLRAGVILGSRRLRAASAFSILDILSLEVFSFPVLGLLGLVTGAGIYRDIGLQIVFGWVASLLLLSPSIMIFRFARSMYSGASLSVLMPSSAILFGLLGSLQGLPGPPGPFAGGPSALFSVLASSVTGASLGSLQAGSPVLAAAAVITFFALTIYATGARRQGQSQAAALSVALAGALGALGWEVACSLFTASPLAMLTLPTAVVGGTLWWVTREAPG